MSDGAWTDAGVSNSTGRRGGATALVLVLAMTTTGCQTARVGAGASGGGRPVTVGDERAAAERARTAPRPVLARGAEAAEPSGSGGLTPVCGAMGLGFSKGDALLLSSLLVLGAPVVIPYYAIKYVVVGPLWVLAKLPGWLRRREEAPAAPAGPARQAPARPTPATPLPPLPAPAAPRPPLPAAPQPPLPAAAAPQPPLPAHTPPRPPSLELRAGPARQEPGCPHGWPAIQEGATPAKPCRSCLRAAAPAPR